MNGMLTLDNWTTNELRFLAPHFSAFSLKGPREVGNNIQFPKPVTGSIVNWIHGGQPIVTDPAKLQKMMQAFKMQ